MFSWKIYFSINFRFYRQIVKNIAEQLKKNVWIKLNFTILLSNAELFPSRCWSEKKKLSCCMNEVQCDWHQRCLFDRTLWSLLELVPRSEATWSCNASAPIQTFRKCIELLKWYKFDCLYFCHLISKKSIIFHFNTFPAMAWMPFVGKISNNFCSSVPCLFGQRWRYFVHLLSIYIG